MSSPSKPGPAAAQAARRAKPPQRRSARLLGLLVWLALAALLAGCATVGQVKPAQPRVDDRLLLSQPHSIGQTFTSRYNGLEGVLVYLEPGNAGAGEVTLRLQPRAAMDGLDLRISSLPLSEIHAPAFYRFYFAPLSGSAGQDYALQLEMDGPGSVSVGRGAAETYIDGALYLDGEPQEAQLAFNLDYDARLLAAGLLQDAGRWLGWTLVMLLAFVLPGWGLLDAAWPGWTRLGWPEKIGLSAGGSLAAYPILFLLTDRIGLHLGAGYAWLPAAAALVWLLYRVVRRGVRLPQGGAWRVATRGLAEWLRRGDVALAAALALLVFTRFWAIRAVDLPLWHDSYQHAVITQLFLDHGGLFDSWAPYSPYHSLSVHYGFSAQAAVLGWMSGVDGSQATLIYGQAANILAIVCLLPLAAYLSRGSRWAGAGVVLVAGLISPMPAYYVNWGRFPQLAGQAILPAAAWLTIELLSRAGGGRTHRCNPTKPGGDNNGPSQTSRWKWIGPVLVTGLTLAGMLLTYYRTAFSFITLMAAIWLLAWALPSFRLDLQRWTWALAAGAGIALATLALLLPWLLQVQGTALSATIETGISRASPWENVSADLVAWTLIRDYFPAILWLPTAAAALWGLWRRRWSIAALPVWIGLWVLYFMGRLVRLPGSNQISNFSILIALYIPFGLLCGWLIGEAAGWLASRKHWLGAGAATAALILAALLSANAARSVTAPVESTLVTRPDLRAMEWIAANTPPEARFLVEGYSIYNRSTAIGSDAGWWIPLLARRENSMPPQYALMNERPQPEDYTLNVVKLTRGLEDVSAASPEGLKLLCENRITHIYIGQRQGQIGFEVRQLFRPQDFVDRPGFELVYRQDRVYVFALSAGTCPQAAATP